jgi:hypothetical protein
VLVLDHLGADAHQLIQAVKTNEISDGNWIGMVRETLINGKRVKKPNQLETKYATLQCKPSQTNIELQHLPVIVNHATTGHKLQGKTVKSSVIVEWLRVKDWSCPSHVNKFGSLFLMSLIPEDINFGPAKDYLDMIQNLRHRILATPEQVSKLENNFG